MIFGVYAMRDIKTGFMTPSLDPNDDAAVRNFYHAVSQSTGVLFTFPADFSLYRIGSFDSDTGVLVSETPIRQIADGASVPHLAVVDQSC